MKKIALVTLLATAVLFSCKKEDLDALLNTASGGITEEEAAEGLRAALSVGTDTSVRILSATNGFYKDELVKVLLPPEANVIVQNITLIPGGQSLIDDLVLKINRSAEDASKNATPVLKNAITSMTVSDAWNILKGSDTSATQYLRDKTFTGLKDAFKPTIQTSLEKEIIAGVSAESSYKSLVNTYNSAANVANILSPGAYPIVTNNSLSDHTTNKALQGLFVKVKEEEKQIRLDPLARVTDILKKVFDALAK